MSGAGKPHRHWVYDQFFEAVPIEKMKEIYSSCDFLLKMSRVESFCLPALEAMACGCIPVVTNFSGYKEFLVNNVNAKVVEMGDTVAARDALRELINNKQLRQKMIDNGKKTAKEWPWEKSIDMLELVIQKKNPVAYYNQKTESYSYKKYREKYL